MGYAFGLLPFGPLPFRVALMSAASIAIAAGCLHRLATLNGAQGFRAAIGALIFPAVFVVWLHGTRVEIYALNAGMTAILALLLLRPEPRWRAAAVVTGLGLGAHATFLLLGAVFWLAALTARKGWRRLLPLLPWGLAGALVIAYLPVAAGRDPFLNWGDPSSLDRLWAHLRAASITGAFEAEMGAGGASMAVMAVSLSRWAALAGGLAFVPLLALGLGSVTWLRASRWVWGALAVGLLGDALFSVFVNPMGQADLQTGVPGALMLSALAALGLGSAPATPTWAPRLAGVALLALLAIAGSDRLGDRAADDLGGDVGRAMLLQTAPTSLTLAANDHLASQSFYLQGVERLRPDALVIVKQSVPVTREIAARYRHAGRELPAGFAELATEDQVGRSHALVRDALPAPVYWELGDSRFDSSMRGALDLRGLLPRVAEPPEEDGSVPESALFQSLDSSGSAGFRTRRVLSDQARLRGAWRYRAGDLPSAQVAFEASVAIDPDNPRSLTNLAVLRDRAGATDVAAELAGRAVELDPGYALAWKNLALYRGKLGDAPGAAEAQATYEALTPGS